MSSPLRPTEPYWKSLKITGKIIEAKELLKAKSLETKSDGKAVGEYYCTARIDNHAGSEFVSQTVPSTENPFWADEFSFQTSIGFRDLRFNVFMLERGKEDIDLGKVVIPKPFIQPSMEQWYMLKDSSNDAKVTGSLQVKIKHFPPKGKRRVHGISVTIVQARDLMRSNNESMSPYVVIHLLPDPEAITTQHTHVQTKAMNPVYNETFFFTFPANQDSLKKELHLGVWNYDHLNENATPVYLGQCLIGIAPIISKLKTIDRWFDLKPAEIDFESYIPRRGSNKKGIGEDEKRSKARNFVKALQTIRSDPPTASKEHQWTEKTFAISNCAGCRSKMMGTQLSCQECQIGCHQKCKDTIKHCGGVGAIRLKIDLSPMIVFRLEKYRHFISLLKKNDYELLILFGKLSAGREEAARCMIRILGPDYKNFVIASVKQEIEQTNDGRTLFRGNSMGSKALDIYMKYIGYDYLRDALQNVIKIVLSNPLPFELDPSRLEKSEVKKGKKDEDMQQVITANATNLKELTNAIADSIFASWAEIPIELRDVFAAIRQFVEEKFKEEVYKYTAISGFIFLRFFAPAILGPPLFGLKVGILDAISYRKLTLIAKTIQNLSNLVSFGQKEPFMEPMNDLINNRMADMKKFIDRISLRIDLNFPLSTRSLNISDQMIALDCAELVGIFTNAMPKLKEVEGNLLSMKLLESELTVLNGELKLIADVEKNLKYDTLYDCGVENTDIIGMEYSADMEGDENKIMRMLTRCSSNSSVDSSMSSLHSGGRPSHAAAGRESLQYGRKSFSTGKNSVTGGRASFGSYRPSSSITENVVKGRLSSVNTKVVNIGEKHEGLDFVQPFAPASSVPKQRGRKMQHLGALKSSLNDSSLRKLENDDDMQLTKSAIIVSECNCEDGTCQNCTQLQRAPSTPIMDASKSIDYLIKPSPLNRSVLGAVKRNPSIRTPTETYHSSSILQTQKPSDKGKDGIEPLPLQQNNRRRSSFLGFAMGEKKCNCEAPIIEKGACTKCGRPEDEKKRKQPEILSKRRTSLVERLQSVSLASVFKKPVESNDDSASNISNHDVDFCTCPQRINESSLSGSECQVCGKPRPTEEAAAKQNKSPRRNRAPSIIMETNIPSICHYCAELAYEIDSLVIDNRKYHLQCLLCSSCSRVMKDSVYSHNNAIYCENCYYVASGLVCGFCDEIISSDYIQLKSAKVHASCGTCQVVSINEVCGANLEGKPYSVVGDSIFCEQHKEGSICCVCLKKIEGTMVESPVSMLLLLVLNLISLVHCTIHAFELFHKNNYTLQCDSYKKPIPECVDVQFSRIHVKEGGLLGLHLYATEPFDVPAVKLTQISTGTEFTLNWLKDGFNIVARLEKSVAAGRYSVKVEPFAAPINVIIDPMETIWYSNVGNTRKHPLLPYILGFGLLIIAIFVIIYKFKPKYKKMNEFEMIEDGFE